MPLSFVVITAIASGSGLALMFKNDSVRSIERALLYVCVLINLFILFAGLYLAQTRRLEPLWITYLSIAIAFVTLIIYSISKYNLLRSESENRPQLF